MTTQEQRNRIASETGYADAMAEPDPTPIPESRSARVWRRIYSLQNSRDYAAPEQAAALTAEIKRLTDLESSE